MLTLNSLIILLPASMVGMVLLGYARAVIQWRKTEQMKPKLVPVSSKRRFESKDTLSQDVL